jgi:transposase-like protein
MSEALPICPTCHSDAVVKNGRTRDRKQSYKCRDCGRQFVEDPQWRAVCEEHRAIIDRLLLEKILLAAIARAMQVSKQCLLSLCQC